MRLGKKLIVLSALAVFLVITVLSLLPPKSGMEIPTNDKVGHFLAYATFSFNLCLLVTRNKQFIWILTFAVCYGILIEFLQGFIPGRQPSFLDIVANSSGVLIGAIVYYLIGDRIHRVLGTR